MHTGFDLLGSQGVGSSSSLRVPPIRARMQDESTAGLVVFRHAWHDLEPDPPLAAPVSSPSPLKVWADRAKQDPRWPRQCPGCGSWMHVRLGPLGFLLRMRRRPLRCCSIFLGQTSRSILSRPTPRPRPPSSRTPFAHFAHGRPRMRGRACGGLLPRGCLLYPFDAADHLTRVDPGGARALPKTRNHPR